jgi:hypothetical protein
LYVLVIARAGLGPRALELGREGAAVVGRHLSLFGAEIRLVAYDDEGDVLGGLRGRLTLDARRVRHTSRYTRLGLVLWCLRGG